MKRMSLQWRLTCIITVYIAVICGCLTMFVYKNGVYTLITFTASSSLLPPTREQMNSAVLQKTVQDLQN